MEIFISTAPYIVITHIISRGELGLDLEPKMLFIPLEVQYFTDLHMKCPTLPPMRKIYYASLSKEEYF